MNTSLLMREKFPFVGLDDDMIEVPLVLQPREPIILPDFVFEETPSQANTSVDSFELIEEEKDESSNSSSAIEDMQTYLSEPENPPSIIENKTNPNEISPKESFDQIQTEIISDTAEQMTKARGHERMTTTLNDTMHEDTQVKRNGLAILFHDFLSSIFFVSSVFRFSSVRPKLKLNVHT